MPLIIANKMTLYLCGIFARLSIYSDID